jgi:hypothetical protein
MKQLLPSELVAEIRLFQRRSGSNNKYEFQESVKMLEVWLTPEETNVAYTYFVPISPL